MSLQSVKAFFQQLELNLPIIELDVSTATVALAAEAHGVEPRPNCENTRFQTERRSSVVGGGQR